MTETNNENLEKILTMAEAAKETGYHQDYLSYLSRHGKLKAFKIGRNWFVKKADLDQFIQDYKNGISEVTDEAGQKIKVHLEDGKAKAVEKPLLEEAPAMAGETPIKAPALPDLSALRSEVLGSLAEQVKNLNESMETLKGRVQDFDAMQPAVVGAVATAPTEDEENDVVMVLPPMGGLQQNKVFGADFKNKFAPSADLGEGVFSDPVTAQAAPAFDQSSVKKLFQSFKFQPNIGNKVMAYATVVAVAGFVMSVGWWYMFGNMQSSQLTQISYGGSKQTAISRQQTAGGNQQTGNTIVEKNINQTVNQVLGYDQSQLNNLIDDQLNQYLNQGKFIGPKGDTGPSGGVPVTYVQQAPGGSDPPGSLVGVTYLSASNFSTDLANINTLNVQGNSVFNGGATFNSDVSLNGTTTALNLDVTNLSLGFTPGSVVFQGSAGLTQDNSNLFYNSSTTQLAVGTSTPSASALLELDSTNKGFLAPRMTQAQRDAIASPAQGLLVFNTNTNQYNFFDGSTWNAVGTGTGGGGSGSGTVATGTPGSFAYYSSATTSVGPQSLLFLSGQKLGIGTTTPASEVTIQATGTPSNLFTIASTSGASLVVVDGNGNVSLNQNLTVAGLSSLATTTISQLTVSGNATTTGNQVISGTFLANGTVTLATTTVSQLTVTGNELVGGNATVTGSSYLGSNLQVNGTTTIATLGTGVVRSLAGALFNGLVGNSDLVNASITISTTTGITGGGTVALGGSINIGLASTGTPGTYGSASTVPVFTTNQFGQITSVSNTAITISTSSLSGILGIANGGTGSSTLGSTLIGFVNNGTKNFVLL